MEVHAIIALLVLMHQIVEALVVKNAHPVPMLHIVEALFAKDAHLVLMLLNMVPLIVTYVL